MTPVLLLFVALVSAGALFAQKICVFPWPGFYSKGQKNKQTCVGGKADLGGLNMGDNTEW